MALLNRREPTNVIPPPGSQTEIHRNNRPGWLTLLAAAAAVLIVSTLLVFGGRWVYRSINNDSTKQPAIQPRNTAKTPTPQPTVGSANRTLAPTPTPSTNNLPQSGPGDVAALFIGISLAAAGLHYIVRLRRA